MKILISIIFIFLISCSDKSNLESDASDFFEQETTVEINDGDNLEELKISSPLKPQNPTTLSQKNCPNGWKKECINSKICFCKFESLQQNCPENWIKSKKIIEITSQKDWKKQIENAPDNSVFKFDEGIFEGNLKIENKNFIFIGTKGKTVIKSDLDNPILENINGSLKVCNITFDSKRGIISNGNLFLTNVEIKNSFGIGIEIDSHKAELDSVLIQDIKSPENGTAKAILIDNDAEVKILNLALLNNKNAGILLCKSEGCTAKLFFDNIFIKDTLLNKNGHLGYGFVAQKKSEITGKNLTILNGKTFGLSVLGSKNDEFFPKTSIENVVINNISSQKDEQYGYGVFLEDNQQTKLNNIFVSNFQNAGILISGCKTADCKNSKIEISNFMVQDAKSSLNNDFGDGIVVLDNVFATFSKGIVKNNFSYGVLVSNIKNQNHTIVNLDNVQILDTKPSKNDGFAGFGLGIFQNAFVDLKVAEISNNFSAGILIYGDSDFETTLKASDLRIFDNKSRKSDGEFGAGLICASNCELFMENSAISNNQESGIMCSGNSNATIKNSIITKTKARECFLQKNCSYNINSAMGQGLTVFDFSQVTLFNSIFDDNLIGVQLFNSKIFIDKNSKIEISNNKIGLNSWDLPNGFELQKIFSNCIFYKNETRFASDKQFSQKPVDFSKN